VTASPERRAVALAAALILAGACLIATGYLIQTAPQEG
jgi:hypothetical protein